MAGHSDRAAPRALAIGALALVASGCLHDRPDSGGFWQLVEGIDGPLRPEVGKGTDAPPAPAALRVVSFNVQHASDVPRLAAAIVASPALDRAHVLLLQEMESHPGEPISRARRLAMLLGIGHYVYAPARPLGNGATHGLAVLSRFPIRSAAVMPLPYFELPGEGSRRIALAVTLEVGDRTQQLITVHLDTRLNIKQRLQQVRPAVELADEQVIISGDFNSNPYAWLGRAIPLPSALDQATALDQYMRGRGFDAPTAASGSTMNILLPKMRLDAIYSRRLAVDSWAVDRSVGVSDHFPLWADVRWPPAS